MKQKVTSGQLYDLDLVDSHLALQQKEFLENAQNLMKRQQTNTETDHLKSDRPLESPIEGH